MSIVPVVGALLSMTKRGSEQLDADELLSGVVGRLISTKDTENIPINKQAN